MKEIVHHTVQDRGSRAYVKDKAPFLAAGNDNYLGIAFYFWHDSAELAHWWGRAHCRDKYMICSGTLHCQDEHYLDLVGSPAQMRDLRELEQDLKGEIAREYADTEKLPLSNLIDFLETLNATMKWNGVFPYHVIRAVDSSTNERSLHGRLFVHHRPGSISLMPRIMFRVKEKKHLNLENFDIIFPQLSLKQELL